MSKGKVVVLGVNGHIGQAVAQAFAAAGWDVRGMARADRPTIAGVRIVRGDAGSVADMKAAIGDASLVVNALNLPYESWDKGRMEALMARVLEAMGTDGKTMLFPGNIYNYSASDRVVTPDMPQHPQTARGAIRVRVEQMLREAAGRGDIQLLIVRAGDFYGPGSSNDWYDLAMMTGARKGRVQVVGSPGAGHSWAYLPDLARAFEAVGAMRSSLGSSETFHFAGHFATAEQLGAAIAEAAPAHVRIGRFPHALLRLMGVFNARMREIARMEYLWRYSMELRDERLDALLGPGFGTRFEDAVAATVAPFFAVAPAVANGPARA